jgi:hypothetical protein
MATDATEPRVERETLTPEVRALYVQQQADLAEQERAWRKGKGQGRPDWEALATDLGPRGEGWAMLNAAPDRRTRNDTDPLGETVYLMGCRPWEAWEDLAEQPEAMEAKIRAAEVRATETRGVLVELPHLCPVCSGRVRHWDRYCLRCDRSGKDGRVRFRGLPVGSAMRADYKGEGTKYAPAGDLRGGRG